ncbi:hypothetical protein NQ318_020276 [Aromia moschata]|uniref:C3H1-type domain-containing protein n=1 Tax=Aromia moschata TaxID=1265417 RepID=A0AAV8ZAK3_9CUCU|nr:hypothetical protein NQ318_020276 [Aromia moschata]
MAAVTSEIILLYQIMHAAMLQESDLFMDALTAATAKKEPKKRKRRPSVTKEASSPSSSPARDPSQPSTPTSPPTNGASSNKDAPSSPSESATEPSEENNEPLASPATPTDNANEEEPVSPKRVKFDGALKGVLLYAKKKGPKKSISWKTEGDLVEIRYFELDETERVNVTKTFGDMAKMEMSSEREAIQMSRKIPDPLAVPGNKSLEKDIQFAREKSVLQALYFDKRRIPDSPEEPIPENHQMSDPVLIPLEDPESQEIDLRSTPWPEPKGSPPHVEPQIPPHIFPNLQNTYTPPFNNMPPPQFQGMPPRFGGQGAPGPVGPGNFMPPNLMPNGNMMGPPGMAPPQEMMNQGPMGPNMFPPGPGPDGFRPGPDFPMFGNQNPPNNMNMFPPNNFNPHRPANRGFRRGGGGGGNWVRMSGPNNNNWKRGGGGGHRGGRLCKNIQNHGYCRNGDNCPFVHP